MDAAQSAQLAEIEALLGDRRKIEQWIATLESRREATPAHVYARVHADYTAKFDAAQSALQQRVDAVTSVAQSLEQDLAEQERGIDDRRDARAEAELRALVGEFSEAEWEERRAALDDDLSRLQDTRDDLARELDQLRTLLAEARPGFVAASPPVVAVPATVVPAQESAVAPVPEPVVEPVVEQVVEPVVESVVEPVIESVVEPVVEPADASVAPPETLREVDPLIPAVEEPAPTAPTHPTPTTKPDWASVFTQKPSALEEDEGLFAELSAPAAPVAEDPPTPPPAPPVPQERDELAFLRSVLGRSTPVATPAPLPAVLDEPPAASITPPAAHTPLELSADEARHSGAFPVGDRPLGAPTPHTSQAARTLTCQECGAMNFPTEWYCEKCGGELAAY